MLEHCLEMGYDLKMVAQPKLFSIFKIISADLKRFNLTQNNTINLLQNKSMDWFLYDRDLCHERVNK